ncbi:MAG: NYN domain-containing protein [Dehalococcoidales bacterium]|nr:NYN domain-containing protein [Dehalococcoidales bacterium]
MVKVIVYVDGFNLYFGLRESGFKKYYWLNIRLLAEKLLMFNQELVFTKYFTARITDDPEKEKRQATYIEALETLRDYNDFEIYYGHYRKDPFKCPRCRQVYKVPHEKKTDVNIATEMLLDAFSDKFEKALLISADSDLVPPIEAIKNKYPDKDVIVAFPPRRYSTELENVTTSFHINRANLAQSQFPETITKSDGFILQRPAEWS